MSTIQEISELSSGEAGAAVLVEALGVQQASELRHLNWEKASSILRISSPECPLDT